MTSDELAGRVAVTVSEAQSRITGVGADQYEISNNEQRFEGKSVAAMLGALREELLDIINYAVMLDVLVQRNITDVSRFVDISDVQVVNQVCESAGYERPYLGYLAHSDPE